MKTIAVLLIALATTAQATIIHFNGNITSVGGTPPIMAQVGDPFRGTLVYDPNQPYNQYGDPNVSLTINITTVLGTFSTSLEPVYSFYDGGFVPSIGGESMSQYETMAIIFLNPELSSFSGGVIFWAECIGCDRLGEVEASGISSVTAPESGSTLMLLGLSLAGVAMLPWMRNTLGTIRFI
jgi:hypothetical protein